MKEKDEREPLLHVEENHAKGFLICEVQMKKTKRENIRFNCSTNKRNYTTENYIAFTINKIGFAFLVDLISSASVCESIILVA